jgi:hypothetical protein
MKKLFVLSGILIFVGLRPAPAQTCQGVTMQKGGGFEMISYDGKGKSNGTAVYTVTNATSENGQTVLEVAFESFDRKGASQMKNTYKMRCDGNQLRIDSRSMLAPDQMKMYENMEMTFTSDDVVYPDKLVVEQRLDDASMRGEGSSGPMKMTFDMSMTNRKVAAQEKVTVPAGTFDAYKVTSDMTIKSKAGIGMTFDFQTVSYRAPGVLWDVRSETFRKGKLMGYSELSKVF